MVQHFILILLAGEQMPGVKKLLHILNNNISGGAVSVKLWKNIGMTERDKNGKFIMVDDPWAETGYRFYYK